jgi:hypothetical protein
MTDDDLLDFDKDQLADWDEVRAQRLLAEQPAIYRNHLTIAKWIDDWRDRMRPEDFSSTDFQVGFVRAIEEIAAFLRQGDLAPGGPLLERS